MKKTFISMCIIGLLFIAPSTVLSQSDVPLLMPVEPVSPLHPSPSVNQDENATAYISRGITNFTTTPTGKYALEKISDILDGQPVDMSIQNGLVAIAMAEGGIQIINITNPRKMELLSTIDKPVSSLSDMFYDSVFLYQNYLYASGSGLLEIYDIQNPYTPQIIHIIEQPVYEIFINNSIAYLLNPSGVQLLNVSNPYDPVLLGSYSQNNFLYKMLVFDNLLFLGASPGDLIILNIADPYSPQFISKISIGENILSIAYQSSQNILYVGNNGNESIVAIDLKDLYRPTKIIGYETVPYNKNNTAASITILDPKGITIENDLAFIADIGNIVTVNISDPLAPSVIFNLESKLSRYTTQSLRFGSLLFALDRFTQLYVVDVSDVYNQSIIGNFSSIAIVNDITVQGNVLFVSAQEGFYSVNITDFNRIYVLDRFAPAVGGYTKAVIQGSLAFLIATTGGISVFDISDPKNLTLLTEFSLGYWYRDLAINGDLLVILEPSRITLMNVSNPYNPVSLANIALANYSYQIEIQGNYLFVLDALGFDIFDISNPTNPFSVQDIITPFLSIEPFLTVTDQYAFIAYDNILAIYNITLPGTSSLLSSITLPPSSSNTPPSMILYNQTVIVKGAQSLLVVVNITDILNPIIEQTFDPLFYLSLHFISGKIFAKQSGGLISLSLLRQPPAREIVFEYSIYLYPYAANLGTPLSFGLWINDTSWINTSFLHIKTTLKNQTYPVNFDLGNYFNTTVSFSNDIPIRFAYEIQTTSGSTIWLDNNGTWYPTGLKAPEEPDNDPPQLLSITFPQEIEQGKIARIMITLSDISGIYLATLYHRLDNGGWKQSEMVKTNSNETIASFRSSIRDTNSLYSTIEFYIEAADMKNNKKIYEDSSFRIKIVPPNTKTYNNPYEQDTSSEIISPPELPLSFPWQSFLFLILLLTPTSRIISRRK